MDDEPGDNRPAFGERHADEHPQEDAAHHAGIAAHGDQRSRGGATDADGRTGHGDTGFDQVQPVFDIRVGHAGTTSASICVISSVVCCCCQIIQSSFHSVKFRS